MSGCYVPFLPKPDPPFLNCCGLIGVFLCTCCIFWRLLSHQSMNSQQDSPLIIINHINLLSTNNHYLTPFGVMETSVHYHISCMILTLIRVHLHFHLAMSNNWISSKTLLFVIISSNLYLTPQMTIFLSMILVPLLALLHKIQICGLSWMYYFYQWYLKGQWSYKKRDPHSQVHWQ